MMLFVVVTVGTILGASWFTYWVTGSRVALSVTLLTGVVTCIVAVAYKIVVKGEQAVD